MTRGPEGFLGRLKRTDPYRAGVLQSELEWEARHPRPTYIPPPIIPSSPEEMRTMSAASLYESSDAARAVRELVTLTVGQRASVYFDGKGLRFHGFDITPISGVFRSKPRIITPLGANSFYDGLTWGDYRISTHQDNSNKGVIIEMTPEGLLYVHGAKTWLAPNWQHDSGSEEIAIGTAFDDPIPIKYHPSPSYSSDSSYDGRENWGGGP